MAQAESVKTSIPSAWKPVEKPVKKANATLAQRIEILDWFHANGKNQKKTAMHFDNVYPSLRLTQPLISVWLKDGSKWRVQYETSTSLSHSAKRFHQTQHPEISEMLDLWISKAMADNVLITGEVLHQKWKKFTDLCGVPDDECPSLSERCLTKLKLWNGLKGIKQHGEAASAFLEIVEKERECLHELIIMGRYECRDIFNGDETSLFYAWVFFFWNINHI